MMKTFLFFQFTKKVQSVRSSVLFSTGSAILKTEYSDYTLTACVMVETVRSESFPPPLQNRLACRFYRFRKH